MEAVGDLVHHVVKELGDVCAGLARGVLHCHRPRLLADLHTEQRLGSAVAVRAATEPAPRSAWGLAARSAAT